MEQDKVQDKVLKQALPYLEGTGWIRSRTSHAPVDAFGEPLPWITYPAIHLLSQRVRPDMSVFEYGCGNSTLWWASRVGSVTSVEHNEEWADRIAGQVPANTTVTQLPLERGGVYSQAALRSPPRSFHVVVIDGRDRVNCAFCAPTALRDDGVIVWDNTDRSRYLRGMRFLAKHGFRRLPLVGLGPFTNRQWETSIFYRPQNCLDL